MTRLTLSHQHDVPNVNFLPSTLADMTLRTSSPQLQFGKTGVRGFHIIMRAGMKELNYANIVKLGNNFREPYPPD